MPEQFFILEPTVWDQMMGSRLYPFSASAIEHHRYRFRIEMGSLSVDSSQGYFLEDEPDWTYRGTCPLEEVFLEWVGPNLCLHGPLDEYLEVHGEERSSVLASWLREHGVTRELKPD